MPRQPAGWLKRFPNQFRWCLSVTSLLFGLIPGNLSTTQAETSAAPNPRFSLVLGGEGVRDAGTGLIWEQQPDYVHDVWSASLERCRGKNVGSLGGWRAPSVTELKTLLDLSQRDPAMPKGHPFSNVKSSIYWTATPSPTDDIVAWQISFLSGEAVTDQKSGTRRAWCVHDADSAIK
jgi:hypothetical protein